MTNSNKPEKIKEWLENVVHGIYTVGTDGLINVPGNVVIRDRVPGGKLPVKFGTVNGHFIATNIGLESLEGFPRYVGGDCFINNNDKLSSVAGAPGEIGGCFFCDNCRLESLEGGPKVVRADFICSYNPLKNVDGAGEIGGNFICDGAVEDIQEAEAVMAEKVAGKPCFGLARSKWLEEDAREWAEVIRCQ